MGHRMPVHKPGTKPERAADPRPSASARGYGHRWRQLRLMVLRREPLCRQCGKNGVIKAAVDVDHIMPKDLDTPAQCVEVNELQPLCHECHSAKTANEDGGFGHEVPER